MTTIDPSGYSEAGAHLFTWLADKVLGGAKKAFGWGWTQVEWAKAQDRYDARIIQDYGQIRIFGQTTPKSLKDIFTDVYVLDTPTAYRRFDPAAVAEHLWNKDRGLSFRHEERRPGEQLLSDGSKFHILGKPGAGKTTFLKHLAVREAQRGKWGPCLGKIPIFVSLKQYDETSQSLFDFIVDEFAVCGFPDAAPFIEALLKEGQALVLFDGLDEVSKTEEHDRRGEVTQMLAQFARQYRECHIVVTCRIAAVDYTFEPAFTYLEMADFAPDQVEAFVHAWFWDEGDKDGGIALAEGMLAALKLPEHKGIRDLSRNPLLLTLLCLNYAETLNFPARRVEIYEEALDALLKKWDSSRRIQRGGLYKTLSLGRKRQMFARIAFDALERGEIVFPQANLERWLVEYLVNVPELPPAIDIDGEAVLGEIVAQHGIFTEQARGLYTFAHLIFQEYYSARFIADSAGSDALDILLGHTGDDKWREVFLLTASLLPDATAFLTSFEQALQTLWERRPQLVIWLRLLDLQSTTSRTAYRRSSIRLYYALAHVKAHALDCALDIARGRSQDGNVASAGTRARVFRRDMALKRMLRFDRELIQALARVLDFDSDLSNDLALALLLDRDLDLARVNDVNFDRYMARRTVEMREAIIDFCLQRGLTELSTAISELELAPLGSISVDWERSLLRLDEAVEKSGILAHYRSLEAEVKASMKKQKRHWLSEPKDILALHAIADATSLFCDCLQLAYTLDRRAFEDRIFLPPP